MKYMQFPINDYIVIIAFSSLGLLTEKTAGLKKDYYRAMHFCRTLQSNRSILVELIRNS